MDDVFSKCFNKLQKSEKARETRLKKQTKEADIFEKPTKSKPKTVTKKKPSKLDRFLAKKGIEKGTVVESLQKRPGRDLDKPHLFTAKKDVIHQADLIYLPSDDGHRYALVVVDTATRLTDAEPLKFTNRKQGRSAKLTLDAFKRIYGRKKKDRILELPSLMMMVGGGGEFSKDVLKYFTDRKVVVRKGKSGRSRQQAMVESHNGLISKLISRRQAEQEMVTGEPSREWVADLPLAIEAINEGFSEDERGTKPLKDTDLPGGDSPVCKASSCDLIPKGTKARAIADKPIDIATGKKLAGGFRAGDARWEPSIRTVTQQILKPGSPPLYRLSGRKGVAYTKAQLQIVSKDEKQSSDAAQDKFIIDKLLPEKKKINGKVHIRVKWKDPTGKCKKAGTELGWEPLANLKRDVPELVKAIQKEMRSSKK